jgi:hypothetical protein
MSPYPPGMLCRVPKKNNKKITKRGGEKTRPQSGTWNDGDGTGSATRSPHEQGSLYPPPGTGSNRRRLREGRANAISAPHERPDQTHATFFFFNLRITLGISGRPLFPSATNKCNLFPARQDPGGSLPLSTETEQGIFQLVSAETTTRPATLKPTFPSLQARQESKAKSKRAGWVISRKPPRACVCAVPERAQGSRIHHQERTEQVPCAQRSRTTPVQAIARIRGESVQLLALVRQARKQKHLCSRNATLLLDRYPDVSGVG